MNQRIQASIDLNVPASTAYNQWTQFERMPQIMQHVERVEQRDDRTLRWHAKLGGREFAWTAEITEQIPEKRIAWAARDGADHAGVVTFHRLTDRECRVQVQLDFEPHGVMERVGTMFGVPKQGIRDDLQRFKEFLETHGKETGAWRGEIQSPDSSAPRPVTAEESAHAHAEAEMRAKAQVTRERDPGAPAPKSHGAPPTSSARPADQKPMDTDVTDTQWGTR